MYSEEYLHQTKQPLIVGIAVFFIVLEVLATVLRFVSKRIGGVRIGWDDAFVVLGLIFCAGDAGCIIGMKSTGLYYGSSIIVVFVANL